MPVSLDSMMPASKSLEFVADKEPWAQYTLDNGAVVRVRVMLVKATATDQFSPDGFPLIQLGCQQVIDVDWPADIAAEAEKRRKAAG